ncbi:hypothetical protein PVT67_03870 [Gallaecimonas kandeliae]|uniref:hypothetical protein n=1 Tax=Gallaecimonas kandeliae TaxID=3029055 RepID=UPI0026484C21|nr:hypothetical protein [Gallaecimonas kandeliae]WKE66399.1 hypothetical protein PVT67_03870 [Gallaecimonas kandeliae]
MLSYRWQRYWLPAFLIALLETGLCLWWGRSALFAALMAINLGAWTFFSWRGADPRSRIQVKEGVLWMAGKATVPLSELNAVVVSKGYFSLHDRYVDGRVPELRFDPLHDQDLIAHLQTIKPGLRIINSLVPVPLKTLSAAKDGQEKPQ